jgi:hypothetical protein
MKRAVAATLSALVFAGIGYFVGFSVGLLGWMPACILGLVGASFGLLVSEVGVKAFWLPVVGCVLGLLGVFAAELLSARGGIDLMYYVFVSVLASVGVTLLSSLVLLAPSIRRRVFRRRN